jgi:hypothetical protein
MAAAFARAVVLLREMAERLRNDNVSFGWPRCARTDMISSSLPISSRCASMDRGRQTRGRLGTAILAVAIGAVAWAATPAPAAARVFVDIGVGVPFPGFYPAYPYPYYYPPPYYPPAAYYPPAPAAYYPPAAPAAAAAVPTPAAPANITYTERAPFKNTAGQTCREYRTAGGTFGTACQEGSGQWRVAN